MKKIRTGKMYQHTNHHIKHHNHPTWVPATSATPDLRRGQGMTSGGATFGGEDKVQRIWNVWHDRVAGMAIGGLHIVEEYA